MDGLNIDKILIKNRRLRGLTQEDIAKYFGVSKSAVSKWETGQSYPDVLLLPQIATYYGISIDELLGYTPQLSNREIRKMYQRYANSLTEENLELMLDEIEENIRRYYSCYPFITSMAQLYLNKSFTIATKKEEFLARSYELAENVISSCSDTNLIDICKGMNSSNLLIQNKPTEVFEILGDELPLSTDAINSMTLIQAYTMLGNIDKANELCQVTIYQLVLNLMGALQVYQQLNLRDANLAEKIYKQEQALFEKFNLKDNSLNPTFAMNLLAAQSFILNGENDKAVKAIKEYYKIVSTLEFPLVMNQNSYFDKINKWLDNNLYLGDIMPSGENEIKRNLLAGVIDNPVFKVLDDIDEYKVIKKNLAKALEVK